MNCVCVHRKSQEPISFHALIIHRNCLKCHYLFKFVLCVMSRAYIVDFCMCHSVFKRELLADGWLLHMRIDFHVSTHFIGLFKTPTHRNVNAMKFILTVVSHSPILSSSLFVISYDLFSNRAFLSTFLKNLFFYSKIWDFLNSNSFSYATQIP